MSSIKISELRPAGCELFQDAESFLYELTDEERGALGGGYLVASIVTYSISIQTQGIIAIPGDAAIFSNVGVDKETAVLFNDQILSLKTNLNTAVVVN